MSGYCKLWMNGLQVVHYFTPEVIKFLHKTPMWPTGGNFHNTTPNNGVKLDLLDEEDFTYSSGQEEKSHGSDLVNKVIETDNRYIRNGIKNLLLSHGSMKYVDFNL